MLSFTTRGLLTKSTYGNGHTIGFTYDMFDRVTAKSYNDIVKARFRYDKFGNLYETQDLFTNITYRYNYDLIGRISGINGTNGTSLNYVYDNLNRVSKYVAKIGNNTNATEYIYGDSALNGQKNGLIYGVKQNDVQRISYAYDELSRLSTRTLNTTTPFVTQYSYHQGATAGSTTALVKTVQNGNDVYEYAYDAVGNITQIKKNGTVYESYTYDDLGQLTLISRGGIDFYDHYYDDNGNLLSVGNNGVTIKSYTYGDSDWRDLLTEFNGQTITYDYIGNPLQYRDGFNFTWSNGRQLTGITKGTNSISYLYNADGLRASKTVNGTTTDYYWLEGVLLGQKTGNDYIIYLYDENGTAYGIICNNTYYYYVFNAQGDVVGIIDQNGTQVVSYDYSAWGEVYSITGTMADTLGQTNPIRYRGYYYDNETGFYYLQSRYYDPVTQRFINADGYVSTGQGILGNNMFAYCANNPVNYADPTGESFVELVKTLIEIIETVVLYVQLNRMGFENITYQSAKDCSNTLKKNGIDTIEEKAHFFSQCYVEGGISLLEAGFLSEEDAEAYRKQRSYYPYYGAGYIQITWDFNYKAFSEYVGDPNIYNYGPKYVAENYAWSAAGWYWTTKNINYAISAGATVVEVTEIVNGGHEKLNERISKYNEYLGFFGG